MNALILNENAGKLFRFLPKVVTAVLVVILAIMLASLFWLFVAPQTSTPLAVSSQQQEMVKPQGRVQNFGSLVAKQHIFGKKEAVKRELPKPKAAAPVVTRLNLVLHGIVAREGRKSYAIIADGAKGKQSIYAVGEEPQTGVTIDSILPRKVMLRHSGKLEELMLPEKKKVSHSNAHLPSVPSSLPTPAMLGNQPQLHGGSVAGRLPEDDLGALRDTLTNNPDKILEIASITEAKDKDGNLTGFRLSPGKNRKLFRKLGLRPGDIVTQVNGVTLDSPAKGLMVMSELATAASVSLTVKRGTQEVTIDKPF